jgi:hypothetical protein
MRFLVLPALLLAVLLPATSVPAARTSPLEPVRLAAALKGQEIGLGEKPATKEKRSLGKAIARLDRPRFDFLDDLRAAGPVCRWLEGAFPEDDQIGPALGDALDGLREEALADRAALLAWLGRMGSDKKDLQLGGGIQRMDGIVLESDGAESRAERAVLLLKAARVLAHTRKILDIEPPRIAPPPFEGLAPDFTLTDLNPDSATTGSPISPRDYVDKISAWYFTHTT